MFCGVFSHFFALAADEIPSALTLSNASYQHQLMYIAIESNINKPMHHYRAFEKYFFQNVETSSNVCTWRGVCCDDAIITSFFFSSLPADSQRLYWEIDLNWLPSSIEIVHLNNIVPASPWKPERLPRAIRYLHFWGVPMQRKVSQKCSLRNLPSIHLINCWTGGSVVLIDLPASMRFCSIMQWDLSRVYVDNAILSDKLEVLSIYVGPRTKYIPIGEAQWDERVKRLAEREDFFNLEMSSEMYKKYSAIGDKHSVISEDVL